MSTHNTNPPETRCGFIALVGAPNVGKSTMVNAMIGQKVTIVSPKPQTTRAIMMGIKMAGPTQLIFVDTPGIFKPRQRLERAIVKEAWRGFYEVDYVALVVDGSKGICGGTRHVIEALQKEKRPACVIINKVDLIKASVLLPLSQELYDTKLFEQVFMVSAIHGDGVQDVVNFLSTKAPTGPWQYPENDFSSAPIQFLAAEMTREQIYLETEQELPYSTCIETEEFEEKADGSLLIRQVIYVLRDAQKKIIIGKHGSKIKHISETARKELESTLNRKVHLFLHVKVKDNWTERPEHYDMMQLDFPK
ncbi:MAG: GTPase Era [Alphaproteobacteria bacterium]|nr:GTPase Era [Alphaproteobacteria bacterium]